MPIIIADDALDDAQQRAFDQGVQALGALVRALLERVATADVRQRIAEERCYMQGFAEGQRFERLGNRAFLVETPS